MGNKERLFGSLTVGNQLWTLTLLLGVMKVVSFIVSISVEGRLVSDSTMMFLM